jgi:NADH-quinone oxidoreductase subunit J
MTLYGVIFYLLGFIVVAATALAITRRHTVHAVVYLIISFFGTAPLFYLLGAPFLAILEVIIYAGAIMVLFLFIIMMLRIEPSGKATWTYVRQWLPAVIMGAASLAAIVLILLTEPQAALPLQAASASPLQFGRFLFEKYWFAVEIASFLLFAALVGALYLGRRESSP